MRRLAAAALAVAGLCGTSRAVAQTPEPPRPRPTLAFGVDVYEGPKPRTSSADYGESGGIGVSGSAGMSFESEDRPLSAQIEVSYRRLLPTEQLVPTHVLGLRASGGWRFDPLNPSYGHYLMLSLGLGAYLPPDRYASWHAPALGLDGAMRQGRPGRGAFAEERITVILSSPGPAFLFSVSLGGYPGR